ncbi:NAD-dependent epimerase/dehydratase family protein [Rossellomorea sp. SC111]|nr:NAD-dependent epimerase/dehydratase family protein [Rossellomorea sp. SC111]
MKAMVTGGAGFIGSHLVDTLISRGYCVHVIDNLSSGKKEYLNPSAIFHNMDITSSEAYDVLLSESPEYVFHLAAQADVSRSTKWPFEDMQTNIAGTLNLLEACRHFPVKSFVFSSTSAVYGNAPTDFIDETCPPSPISFYGLSKFTSESYIKLYGDTFGIPFSILRYGNVYGPRQTSKGEGGVIAVFLETLMKNESLKINGDGLQTRDYVYVQDVVEANILAAAKGNQHIMQIGTGKKTSVLQLINLLQNVHSKKITSFHAQDRQGDIKHSCLDNRFAKRILTWEPQFPIKDGLRKTYWSYTS